MLSNSPEAENSKEILKFQKLKIDLEFFTIFLQIFQMMNIRRKNRPIFSEGSWMCKCWWKKIEEGELSPVVLSLLIGNDSFELVRSWYLEGRT
jgi:hypothetical protein